MKFNHHKPSLVVLVIAVLMPIIVVIAYQFFGYRNESITVQEKTEVETIIEQPGGQKDDQEEAVKEEKDKFEITQQEEEAAEEEKDKFEITLQEEEEELSIEGRILILTTERSRGFVVTQAYLCVGIDGQPVSEEIHKALSERFQIRSVDLSDCSYDAEKGYLVHTESGLDAISFNVKDIEEYGGNSYRNQFSYSVSSYLHNLHSGLEELKVRYHGSFSGREVWVVDEETSLWVS